MGLNSLKNNYYLKINSSVLQIKQNIHSFGGDPNQVTIFGESAGSWSVSAQILSPLSKGLFKKAVIESGAIYDNKKTPILTKAQALSQAKDTAKHLNCSDNQWLDCLRRVDAKLLNSQHRMHPYAIHGTEFLPFTAQEAFKAHSYNSGIKTLIEI